jgi:cytochrome c553
MVERALYAPTMTRLLPARIARAAAPLLIATAAVHTARAQGTAATAFELPEWVYPVPASAPAPAAAPRPDTATRYRVPNSAMRYTMRQIGNTFDPPDWHPATHGKPPAIVAHGRKPAVYACGFCHLPDGRGRPENATLAGLPADYIVQQMMDIASGARRSASSRASRPMELMKQMAESSTVAEMRQAAEYFSRQKLRYGPRVIESRTVPRTHPASGLYVKDAGREVEMLGDRIIEFASDPRRHELRDAAAEYVAYVPPGSLARGRAIATRASRTNPKPCASCHGENLRGVKLVPPIAGRSPTYLMRQLLAFKAGTRSSKDGAPMREVVEHLTVNDMISVAAYVASRQP